MTVSEARFRTRRVMAVSGPIRIVMPVSILIQTVKCAALHLNGLATRRARAIVIKERVKRDDSGDPDLNKREACYTHLNRLATRRARSIVIEERVKRGDSGYPGPSVRRAAPHPRQRERVLY